ncbi:putative 4-coumarate- ligase protein [Neofusicoccum parvum UCRNP2]|uniref:Putative 4-coumarate-ligase protein n=1 Tax=Botryosphaeria parva (strain UCR-NP2) TaxID=1287680 RepID=R1GDD0_BOTPV|nr:putative 4-coumarate- ligase protein [Neofusicoccum parvum UCRNP2]
MPHKSPFQIDIPACNLLDYLFPSGEEPSEEPIWLDAENPERSLSPKQLLQWVKRLGSGLQNLGLEPGDVVMVYSTNHIFVPVAYCETVYQIENTGAKVILVEPSLLSTVLSAATKTKFPLSRIYLFSDTPCPPTQSLHDWRTLLGPPTSTWHWPPLTPTASRTTTAVLNYSSGTTGLPKGVLITHANIIANVTQSLHMRDLAQPYTPSTRPRETWLGFLPLYHAYGQLWTISAAAKTLSRTYLMRSFSYAAFLRLVQRHRVTHVQTAPPLLVLLAKRPETTRFDLRSLRGVLCGAAPLSARLQDEVAARLGVVVVQTDHEELPRAYIVLKDHARNSHISEEDIVAWTASRVAKHKRLLGGVMFIDEVPKSPSGKIQRKIMREWAKRDAETLKSKTVNAKL